MQRFRLVVAFAAVAVVLAGCSSGGHRAVATRPTGTNAQTPVTLPKVGPTADPNDVPNPIPYNVGERTGLPNGWLVEVTRVRRPFTAPGLPPAPSGQQYVAVDVAMTNGGSASEKVDAAKLFTLFDQTGKAHALVNDPGVGNGLDGVYEPGAHRSGTLVFAAPVNLQLRMMLDGPAIGTQQSVFQIDPPKAPPVD